MAKPNKILIIALAAIVALFVLGVVKDQIIKGTAEAVGSQVIGAPLRIGGLSLGVLNQSVRISNLRIYNPRGFSRGVIVDLTKINVSYDILGFLKGKIHLRLVDIELKEMGLEKNKEGKLNVDELKIAKQDNKAKPQKQMPMQMDEVRLSIGRLVSKDYSSGKEPLVQVYEINIKKAYKNISSPQQLAALIMVEPMKAAGIQGAGIYGVAMLTGVAVLPVAVAATFIGKDSAERDFTAGVDRIYEEALALLKRKGQVTSENKDKGVITSVAGGSKITLRISKKEGSKNSVTVSARKLMLPQPQTAGGILYELSEKLK